VAYLTLSSNQRAGVYPIEADSIGIPLIESVITAGILFLCLLVSAGLVALLRFVGRKAKVVVRVLALLLGILSALIAAASAYAWAMPSHYAMASSYASVIIFALVTSYQDLARD
jgi:hypothetical protein